MLISSNSNGVIQAQVTDKLRSQMISIYALVFFGGYLLRSLVMAGRRGPLESKMPFCCRARSCWWRGRPW
jgi:hypothetical protein